MKHKCIKPFCGKEYSSEEVDAYYCPECLEQKKNIAKEIDAKFANRPKKDVENFEQKVAGMQKINGIPMINL